MPAMLCDIDVCISCLPGLMTACVNLNHDGPPNEILGIFGFLSPSSLWELRTHSLNIYIVNLSG